MEELNFKLKHLNHERFLLKPLQILEDWKASSIRTINQFYEEKQREVLELIGLKFTKYQDKIDDIECQLNSIVNGSADNSILENLHHKYKSLEELLNITVTTKSITIDSSCCLLEACDNDQLLLKTESKLKQKEINLEAHQLIWLESNDADADSVRKSIVCLRKIIDYTIIFHDIERCLTFLEQTKGITTFLVSSEEFTDDMLPKIQHLCLNIPFIYVYRYGDERCSDQKHSSNFPKIKHGYTQLNQLLNDLSEDVQTYLKHERITSSFDTLTDHGRTADDVDRSGWSCLITALCSLPYPADCCYRLVHYLKEYYDGNPAQIKVLDEFQSSYTSSDSLHWYTRDSFLFRSFNKALRQRNIELIFLFGFYIKDLYQQLENVSKDFQTETSFTVYRGQLISRMEIKKLKRWEFIINTCFLSTTRKRPLATILLNQSLQLEDEYQSVLFEINVNCEEETLNAPPFADISSFSQFPEECEVLFSNGSQFEIVEAVYSQSEKFWIVKLKLVSNSNLYYGDEYNEMLPITNRTILKKCVRLLPCRLHGMSVDDIHDLFTQLLNLYPTENWLAAFKFWCIAKYYDRHRRTDKNYNVIIKYYGLAIDILTEINDDGCLTDLGKLYTDTGDCYYFEVEDTTVAQKHYHTAATYFENALRKGLIRSGLETLLVEGKIMRLRYDVPSVLPTEKDLKIPRLLRDAYIEGEDEVV